MATILLMEYELGEAQRKLTLADWQERARQIAGLAGLRWKYWLLGRSDDERGGVYLFDLSDDAERAAESLAHSLTSAGAQNVRHRTFEVDPELSVITRGLL